MTTESTWERLDVHVRGHVIVQRARVVEIGTALVTDTRPLAGVRANMSLKIGREHRRVGTVWATM